MCCSVNTPSYLRSFEALQAFLDVREETVQIRGQESQEPLLAGRWRVAHLLPTISLNLILMLFFAMVSLVLLTVGVSRWARETEVITMHNFFALNQIAKILEHGEALLSPLFNTYAFSARSVYLQPALDARELQHDLQLYTTAGGWERLSFYQREGVCRGITNLFGLLYLRTEDLMRERPRHHLQKIAALFADGAPKKAAVLQALCHTDELLGYSRREVHVRDWSRLENGIYDISLPRHRALYIKIDGAHGFLVDPNIGVLEIGNQNPEMEQYLQRDDQRVFKLALN